MRRNEGLFVSLACLIAGCSAMKLFDEEPPQTGERCVRGTMVDCTTTCGSTGSGACTDDGWVPGPEACTPPVEICNGEDDDCDGSTDDGFECARGAAVSCTTTCGSEGTGTCTASCLPPTGAACTPPEEVCDGGDDDCDGDTDEGFPCAVGVAVSCTTTCGSEGTGVCTASCLPPTGAACTPPGEACNNGADDDCDDLTDELSPEQCRPGDTIACRSACDGEGETTGTGTCTDACLPPGSDDCTPAAETCNGRDDDCDEETDEGFGCVAGQPAPCTTSCSSTGTGTCLETCQPATPATCVPPDEICNGLDDDCIGGCDNTFACCAGEESTCTTECGSSGTTTCTEECLVGPCVPPDEECNGDDDDCDDVPDNGFECVQGLPGACAVESCPGTHYCSATCTWGSCDPAWAAMTAVPVPIAPDNGARTGSHRVAGRLRPTFRWLPITPFCGAARFRIQIDDSCPVTGFASCDFPSPEVDEGDIRDTSFRPAADLPVETGAPPFGRRYFWRLQVCDVFDRCTGWGPVRYVDVGREVNDFNGDGYADLLSGAGGYNGSHGRAYVFLGRSSWPLYWEVDADLAIDGGTLWGFGFRAAGIGDINADGFADWLVSTGGSHRLLVYLGAETLDATVDLTVIGPETPFGHSTAGLGDVNSDGYADFGAGAPVALVSGVPRGKVYVYFGGAVLDAVADVVLGGPQYAYSFGVSVAAAGDFNDDGFGDVVVGASDSDIPVVGTDAGRAYVYFGGAPPDTVEDVVFDGAASGDRFGYDVEWAGDVNGDFTSDVIIGSATAQRAYVQLGGRPPSAASRWTIYPPAAEAGFGTVVSGAGDADHDGFHDMLVGCPNNAASDGCAYLFRGGTAAPTAFAESASGNAGAAGQLGSVLGIIGDTNADGFDDCAIGEPYGEGSGIPTDGGLTLLGLGASPTSWRWFQVFSGDVADENQGSSVGAAPPY